MEGEIFDEIVENLLLYSQEEELKVYHNDL